MVVKLKDGVDPVTGARSLQTIVDSTTTFWDNVPGSGGGVFDLLPVQQPAEIVNYKTMGSTPAILAFGLGVGAVTALGLTLVASVRRRRRDLALLKTLGFVKRHVAAVVAWQASVAAVVGIVAGYRSGSSSAAACGTSSPTRSTPSLRRASPPFSSSSSLPAPWYWPTSSPTYLDAWRRQHRPALYSEASRCECGAEVDVSGDVQRRRSRLDLPLSSRRRLMISRRSWRSR